LKGLTQNVQRAEVKKVESDGNEADRFFSLVDDLESDELIQNQNGRKKLLVLKFIAGPLLPTQPKEIKLTGERKLVFGLNESKDPGVFSITGERVIERHFEIEYCNNTLMVKNLNLDCWESCGIYRRVFNDEEYCLRPGNAFRIGTLEFMVERFNTGIVSDIGQR
jgi:hypothetical protein